MLKPSRLRPGDRVAVIAPASPFNRDEFDKGVAELQRLGFEPVFEDTRFRTGKAAISLERRASGRERFSRRGMIHRCARSSPCAGGYGSVHLLPYLDKEDLRATPKAFIGYSDLTSVLAYLTASCGIVSFHGPMLDRRLGRGIDAYDSDTFLRSLTSTEPLGELPAPALEAFSKGEAAGPLMGGTLAQLVASLGTPYAIKPPAGHVLFLEDVSERPYRLDRMLTQLRLAGILDSASAVVLGEFPECDEPGGQPSARSVLAELLKDFAGPVVYGFPSGHTAGPLVTLPFGVRARVLANERPRVIIEEAAVE